MRITARLSQPELHQFFASLLPFTLELGGKDERGERPLTLEQLNSVEFVPERGVRLLLSGSLRWPLLGLELPIRIEAVKVLVSLSRQLRPSAHLVLGLHVEELDVGWVPDSLDRTIAEKINATIREQRLDVAWDFERLLTHRFELPDDVRSTASISLRVENSSVVISPDEVRIDLDLLAATSRRIGDVPPRA